MRRKGQIVGFLAGLGLLMLIFDSRLAVSAAVDGMELCIRTVIPSLFPFIVLSMILTGSLCGSNAGASCAAKVLGIPEAAASVVIPAFLGGYPVGAKCTQELFRAGQISRQQAERMLAFCSNAGPSFLFGMVSGFFPEMKTVWLLWYIQIVGAVTAAALIPVTNASPIQKITLQNRPQKADILPESMKAMGQICSCVVLFRILTAYMQKSCLWLLPQWIQVPMIGFLELTNGCCALSLIGDPQMRFLMASCMLSFGGICVLVQTASVTNGLSLRYYILGKGIQTCVSFLLSICLIQNNGWILGTIPALSLVIIRNRQKSCGNFRSAPV